MHGGHWGPEEFVSEPVTPAAGTGDIAAMGRGEPGLPSGFTWHGREYVITAVLKAWKSSSREGGTGRLYLRKHWYLVETDAGSRMTLYCDRQTRNRRNPKARWWIYSFQNYMEG
jgi:hypothetical protein